MEREGTAEAGNEGDEEEVFISLQHQRKPRRFGSNSASEAAMQLLQDGTPAGVLSLYAGETAKLLRARDAASAEALALRMLEARGGWHDGSAGLAPPPATVLALEEEATRLTLLARLWRAA